MGTSLAGLLPQNTYSGLLKFGDNAALSATLRAISDGAGNDTMLSISTTALQIGGATGLNWDNTNNRLGVGTNVPSGTLSVRGENTTYGSAPSIKIQNSAGATHFEVRNSGLVSILDGTIELTTAVSSIVTTATTIGAFGSLGARLGIKGSGSTSATTSLLVQNSAGSNALQVQDNLNTTFGGTLQLLNGNTYIANQSSTIVLAAVNSATADLHMIPSRQVNINNTGSYTAQASAILQTDSTTKGFLPPRMTTTQKNAIATPAAGLEMYDSTAKSPAYYDGTNWGYTGGALQNTTGNGGTLNVSFAAGNIVNLTLNATTTLAFANAVIGTYIVQVTQSAAGGSSLVYPASVKWAGGTAPTLSTAVGKTDILTFYHDGTNYYGTYSLNY